METNYPLQNTYTLTLLRHGESVGNAKGIRQGQSDFKLTEIGQNQTNLLAARWKREKRTFDTMISSPLPRAIETAEIISKSLNIPYEINPVYMERNNGKLAGLSIAEADKLYPRPGFINLYTPIGITGESLWDLFLRASKAVNQIIKRPPARYLIVSHGGFMDMFIYACLGLVPQPNFHGVHYPFNNAAFSTLEFNVDNGRWRLLNHNDHSHLYNSLYKRILNQSDEDLILFFLRHGESTANAEKRLQGQVEFPLSERGRKQAISLGKHWKSEGLTFDQIFSSPLIRAHQTAEIISKLVQSSLDLEPKWMETDIGNLGGKYYQELSKLPTPPNLYEPYYPVGMSGESRWEAFIRVGGVLATLLQKSPGRYLIVAHGGTLNLAMCAISGISPQTNVPSPGFLFHNTAFAALKFNPKRHYWGVLFTNNTSHLDRKDESND